MTSNDSSAAQPKTPNIIVFRDKLLLPSEGFIKTHYTAFDAANLVYLASHFGWRAAELDGQMMATAPDSLRQFWFKQTGRTCILPDLKSLAPRSVHAHFGRGGALALPLAEALGVPLFVTFHGGDATKETHQRRRLIPTIYQRRLSHLQAYASGFLCVSQFVADRLAAQGFPKAKLITHYIGIDVSGMQQPEQRQGRLLFIGRFVDKKGVEIKGPGEGRLCIAQSWPGQMRTVYGDHQRFIDTYFSQFDGKYFTGDGCRRDRDGYYWITGRVDDVIIVSGHNLGTAEIESAFVAHPKVAEAAVVGYPHDIKGNGLYCYVTLNVGEKEDGDLERELKLWVRKQIGPLATPDFIHFSPGLPKTRSGKIMRRILRKIAANEHDQLGDTTTLADPSVVTSLVENRKNT